MENLKTFLSLSSLTRQRGGRARAPHFVNLLCSSYIFPKYVRDADRTFFFCTIWVMLKLVYITIILVKENLGAC